MRESKDLVLYAKCTAAISISIIISAIYLLLFYNLPLHMESLLSCIWISYPVYFPVVLAAYHKSIALLVLGLCGGFFFVFAGSLFFSPGKEGGVSFAQLPFMFFGLMFSSLFMLVGVMWWKCRSQT